MLNFGFLLSVLSNSLGVCFGLLIVSQQFFQFRKTEHKVPMLTNTALCSLTFLIILPHTAAK